MLEYLSAQNMPKIINFDMSELVRIGQWVGGKDRQMFLCIHISTQSCHLTLIYLDSQGKSYKGGVTPKAYHKSFGCDYQGQLHTHNFF